MNNKGHMLCFLLRFFVFLFFQLEYTEKLNDFFSGNIKRFLLENVEEK